MVDDYGSSIMIMARDRKVACEHADVAVIHHQRKVLRLPTTNKRPENTKLNCCKPQVHSLNTHTTVTYPLNRFFLGCIK